MNHILKIFFIIIKKRMQSNEEENEFYRNQSKELREKYYSVNRE